MKPVFSILLIFLLFSSIFTYGEESFTYGNRVIEINNEISQFYPRYENSQGEKDLFLYLENYFNELTLEYNIFNYSELERDHSFSKGYSLIIEGISQDRLVITAPLNHHRKSTKQNDGSINIAILLQMLEIFSKYKPAVTLEFSFLGAEMGDEDHYPIGSKNYLNNFSITSPTILLYLNLNKAGDTIKLNNSSENDLSPMWLVESFSELFHIKNLSFTNENIQSLAYQSGFESAPNLIKTYLDAEIPALILESNNSKIATLNEAKWANHIIESFLTFILDSQNGFDKEWTRHYLIVKLGKVLFTLDEKEGIIIIISLLALLLLIALLKSRNLHLNLRRFKKHLWAFPLLMFLTFLYLFLSTLLIEELSIIKDFPELWKKSPLLFLIFKLSTTLLLFSSFIFFIKGVSISKSHYFYTYSSFTSVLISLFTVLVFNINYSYFFLWSLLFISLFMMSKKVIIKRISIILSPLPLIIVCYMIFTHPYLEISKFLLLSRINGNIFLTIIIMPTLMLIWSLRNFFQQIYSNKRSIKNIANILVFSIISTGIFFYHIYSAPFNRENKQIIYVEEYININENSRSIKLISPAPMGDISLKLGEQQLTLEDVKRRAQITAPMLDGLLEIYEESSTFLDRLSIQYKIEALGSPDTIEFTISTEKPLIIYNSTFPYEVSSDGRMNVFYIGKNPKMPLELGLIIPRASFPKTTVRLKYSRFPYEFDLNGYNVYDEKLLIIEKQIDWNQN